MMPQLAAVALITRASLVAAGSTVHLAAWGVGAIVRWVNKSASHLQGLYASLAEWLESRCLDPAGMLSDPFSVSAVLRLAREVAASFLGMASFLLFTLTRIGADGPTGLPRAECDPVFLVGRSIETWLTGAAVSISPFMVLFW